MELNKTLIGAKNGNVEDMENILQLFKSKVNAICREYFLIGADFDDILQEGMIGLYKAIQNYNPEKNDNFARFASLCIHRQIQSAVKIANAKKNLPLNEYYSINEDGAIENDKEKSAQIILVTKDRIVEKISLQKEKNSYIINQIKQTLNELQFKILILYLNGYSYNEIATNINSTAKKIDNTIQTIKKKLKKLKLD